MVKQIDARGKACPLPVIEAKRALEAVPEGTKVEVLVDNEIAVQNLCKMAAQKHYAASGSKVEERCYLVEILKNSTDPATGKDVRKDAGKALDQKQEQTPGQVSGDGAKHASEHISEHAPERAADSGEAQDCACTPMAVTEPGLVVVLSSSEMGGKDPALGKLLMKGFVYALTELDRLPETVLLYNGGAWLSCEGSDSLEDLRNLESQGVEILTCGTCLNHYGLSRKLAVGAVTNMYQIATILTEAAKVVKP